MGVRCPKCGLMQVAQNACKKCGAALPGASVAAPSSPRDTKFVAPARVDPTLPDPIFDHDRFLLRQKVMTIGEKYDIWDEHGQPILFIERPSHFLKQLGALAVGLVAGIAIAIPLAMAAAHFDSPLLGVFTALAGLATFIAVAVWMSPFRHIYFYRDESRAERLLQVLQDQKATLFTRTFTILDANGRMLARLSKNPLTDLFRKKWVCRDASGNAICFAMEDSILLAIIRRFVTRLVMLNFIIVRPDGASLGSFNRKFTLFDRYVLDMTPDSGRTLDRRIAVAIGVLLDTGERR